MPLRRHEATFNACLYDSATVNGLEPFSFLLAQLCFLLSLSKQLLLLLMRQK